MFPDSCNGHKLEIHKSFYVAHIVRPHSPERAISGLKIIRWEFQLEPWLSSGPLVAAVPGSLMRRGQLRLNI